MSKNVQVDIQINPNQMAKKIYREKINGKN
jgi:hypothetical protein